MADIELSRKVRALILAFLIVLYLVLYLKVVIVGANNVTAPKEIVNQPLNKTVLPKVGIGIGLVDFETAEEREKVAYMALEAGFRMIDLWEGHEGAVKSALSKANISRNEIFISVKLNPRARKIDDTRMGVQKILERLGVSYIDLLLINRHDKKHLITWKTMIDMKNRGLVRSIGVSNFNENQVHFLHKYTSVLPSVIQLEINPFSQMTSFVRNLTDLGIIVQVQPPFSAHTLHNDSRIIAFSRKYNHSPAQILLQWCLRQNFSCIALSSEEEHLQSNPNEPTFTLEEEDLHFLDRLDPKSERAVYEEHHFKHQNSQRERREAHKREPHAAHQNIENHEYEPEHFDGQVHHEEFDQRGRKHHSPDVFPDPHSDPKRHNKKMERDTRKDRRDPMHHDDDYEGVEFEPEIKKKKKKKRKRRSRSQYEGSEESEHEYPDPTTEPWEEHDSHDRHDSRHFENRRNDDMEGGDVEEIDEFGRKSRSYEFPTGGEEFMEDPYPGSYYHDEL